MNRKHQIEFCRHCDNQSFTSEKGIICKLTNDVAGFEVNCDWFQGDKTLVPYTSEVEEIDYSQFSTKTKDGYPPKPKETEKSQNISHSLISIALSIIAILYIFDLELKYALVIIGVMLIHEIGHYLVMKKYKYKDLGIFFIPLIGALASGKTESPSQKQKVIVSIAGPLPGIIIGSIMLAYGLKTENQLLLEIANIFIVINIFNLIPIMPLDGGQIITTLFFNKKIIIQRVFSIISIMSLCIIALTTQSYFLLIIPLLLFGKIASKKSTQKIIDSLKHKQIDTNKSFSEITDEEYWLIRDEISLLNPYFQKLITTKRYVVSDSEQKIIKYIEGLVQKEPKQDLNLWGKALTISIILVSIGFPFLTILLITI